MQTPDETWDQFKARYRDGWSKNRDKLMMGTTATSGGVSAWDISRDEEDFFVAWEETDDNYIGNWITGFGFINVKFPKATSRPVTDEEFEWFVEHPVTML